MSMQPNYRTHRRDRNTQLSVHSTRTAVQRRAAIKHPHPHPTPQNTTHKPTTTHPQNPYALWSVQTAARYALSFWRNTSSHGSNVANRRNVVTICKPCLHSPRQLRHYIQVGLRYCLGLQAVMEESKFNIVERTTQDAFWLCYFLTLTQVTRTTSRIPRPVAIACSS